MEEVLKDFEDKIAVLTKVIDRFADPDADHQDPELVASCKKQREAYRIAAAALMTHIAVA